MQLRPVRYLAVALALGTLVGAGAAGAEEFGVRVEGPPTGDACLAPAVLPSGALAWCGEVGYPELGLTVREGLGWLELDARARFDYLRLATALEGIAKFGVVRQPNWDLAPYVGVGLVWNAGGTYADAKNFSYGGLRFVAGAISTYALTTNLRLIGQIDVPIDAIVSPGGTTVVEPLVGAGLEYSLGGGWSLFGMANAELLVRQTAGAPSTVDLAPLFRAGLGFRIF